MQHWLVATAIGICLGVALYACVRLRMNVGPIIKQRYGAWARRAYWMANILIMIILANLGLRLLRIYFGNQAPALDSRMLETWFALLTLFVALGLIFNRLYRNHKR
jgi:hypothetical protein